MGTGMNLVTHYELDNTGFGKATKDTSSPVKIPRSIQVRDQQLKTGHLPYQGAETMYKILGTLVVQPWIDKHSLRRWPVIHKLITNVSKVDPVLFKNTIQNLGGDAGGSSNHLPLLNTMHDKLQDMRSF
ncbi:hypothetical protein LA080_009244 [Diaporthe eres]|nr:hypothetical protein LA080_009244 [Diaporthe eres]